MMSDLKREQVNHPNHYTCTSIECIDAMIITFGRKATIDFCKINAFKYLWRHEQKNKKIDIEKARWYISKAKELQKLGPKDDNLSELELLCSRYEKKYEPKKQPKIIPKKCWDEDDEDN